MLGKLLFGRRLQGGARGRPDFLEGIAHRVGGEVERLGDAGERRACGGGLPGLGAPMFPFSGQRNGSCKYKNAAADDEEVLEEGLDGHPWG